MASCLPIFPALTRSTAWLLALALVTACLSGCRSEDDRLAEIAATARASRSRAAADLVKLFHDGKITHDRPITFATELLQRGDDEASLGGAVLDFLDQIRTDLNTAPEFELFWMGVGRLAFWSAHAAYERGREAEALELVFAGPQRWQGESYWLMYPDHDALASYILASAGRRGEAIARLRDRSDLQGEAAEALRRLTRGAN